MIEFAGKLPSPHREILIVAGRVLYASDGAYANFMTQEESNRVVAAYGGNYNRLAKIKSGMIHAICST